MSEMCKSVDPGQLLSKVLQPFCSSQNPVKMPVNTRDAHALSSWIQSQWRQNCISLRLSCGNFNCRWQQVPKWKERWILLKLHLLPTNLWGGFNYKTWVISFTKLIQYDFVMGKERKWFFCSLVFRKRKSSETWNFKCDFKFLHNFLIFCCSLTRRGSWNYS